MGELLHGIRVLDFSRYRAGPTCGQMLGDMGAEVIRIERPGGEDDRQLSPFAAGGQSSYLMFTSRNKKGITLNLRKQKGKELLEEMVRRSDVVIENFGPEVNKRLGLDYESLKQIKPDIILVSVSAFGQYGSYSNRGGFDGVALALSGLMWVSGFPQGSPMKLGVNFVDTATGIYGALGTLYALYHREKTGEGQSVDVSLLDSAVSFMESIVAEYETVNEIRPQVGNSHTYTGPYDAYKAKDGYFFLGVVGNTVWKRFLKMMDREELTSDPRFQSDYDRARPESRQFFTDWFNKWTAEQTVDEVVKQFNADPHIRAREMLVEVEHPEVGKVPLIGIPIKLSKTPGRIKNTAPMLGEHNTAIYCDWLGHTHQELTQLKEEGII